MPRRGRGRGHGRSGRRGNQGRNNADDQKTAEGVKFGKDVLGFFTGNTTFEQHLEAQETEYSRYVAAYIVLMDNGVAISNSARTNMLAVAWGRHDHTFADTLLEDTDNFGFVAVLKALTLLDSGRMTRVWEKRMKRLEMQPRKPKPQTVGNVKKNINNMAAQKTKVGSVSGALCRRIQKWVRKFTAVDLEFFALHFPTESWQKLADICHFNPTKDFPNLPWFLPFCYGEPAPQDSLVGKCKNVNEENVNELVQSYDIPYIHIRNLKDKLTVESKTRVAKYTKSVNTLLWYYEDIRCNEVDNIINQRLESGEQVSLTYGKLVERILTIKLFQSDEDETKGYFVRRLIPQATVGNIRVSLEAPVVVFGDKSASMDVAIRTSTIIASLLTAVTSAKLVFFNDANHDAPYIPEDIEQVIELALTTRAERCTAPAASLLPFYTRKEVVKTFVIVTDEEENTSASNGMRFAPLYQAYCKEVYPARLVFVSFLSSQAAEGDMVTPLRKLGYNPLQFKFDGRRPDLTKLDNLLGLLSVESKSFEDQICSKQEILDSDNGLSKVFEGLSVKSELGQQ